MRAIGPAFLLSGLFAVAAAWWWGRGNTPTADPDPSPTPPTPRLVSFSAHPAANKAPTGDGWIAALEVHVITGTTDHRYGTLVHPTMTGAIEEARTMATRLLEEMAA